jgi:hypothetical protein
MFSELILRFTTKPQEPQQRRGSCKRCMQNREGELFCVFPQTLNIASPWATYSLEDDDDESAEVCRFRRFRFLAFVTNRSSSSSREA